MNTTLKSEQTSLTKAQMYILFAHLFFTEPSPETVERLNISDQETHEDICVDFARLFANASFSPVPPYESVYRGPNHLLMESVRDEVVAAYAKAGFRVDEQYHLPEDHISFELRFLANLCEKENSSSIQSSFFKEHVLTWVPRFCEDVCRNAQTQFYKALASGLQDFIQQEQASM